MCYPNLTNLRICKTVCQMILNLLVLRMLIIFDNKNETSLFIH